MRQFIDLAMEARAGMGQEGRIKMERQFDERTVVERYLEEIAKALDIRTFAQ